jgi:hypothetical protein
LGALQNGVGNVTLKDNGTILKTMAGVFIGVHDGGTGAVKVMDGANFDAPNSFVTVFSNTVLTESSLQISGTNSQMTAGSLRIWSSSAGNSVTQGGTLNVNGRAEIGNVSFYDTSGMGRALFSITPLFFFVPDGGAPTPVSGDHAGELIIGRSGDTSTSIFTWKGFLEVGSQGPNVSQLELGGSGRASSSPAAAGGEHGIIVDDYGKVSVADSSQLTISSLVLKAQLNFVATTSKPEASVSVGSGSVIVGSGSNVSAQAGQLIVTPNGHLEGVGIVTASSIIDNGTIAAKTADTSLNTDLFLHGTISGSGSITIERLCTLFVYGDQSVDVTFGKDSGGRLELMSPGQFKAAIHGLTVGDTIGMDGVTITDQSPITPNSSGYITVHTTGGVFQYQVDGAFGGNVLIANGFSLTLVPASSGVKFKLFDGYLSGATVFADANGNGVLDPGEASALSDGSGSFVLNGSANGPLVASGGTDTFTGLAFGGKLSAPVGFSMVSPLTTLVSGLHAEGIAVDQAQIDVLAAIGANPNYNLASYDPIAAMQAGDPWSATVFTRNVEVADTIQMIASSLTGMGATNVWDQAVSALASAIAHANGQMVDLTDAPTISSLISTAAQAAHVDASQVVDKVAQVVAASNAALDGKLQSEVDDGSFWSTLVSDASAIELVAQGVTSAMLASAGSASAAVDAVVGDFTGANLTGAIATASTTIPASISSVEATTSTGLSTLNAGDQVTISVDVNKTVVVTGIPTLQLNDNEVATYTGGSDTTTLTFVYTVQGSDSTPDLQAVGLNLPNGATIQDHAGKNLTGTVAADLGLQVGSGASPAVAAHDDAYILPQDHPLNVITSDSVLVNDDNATTATLNTGPSHGTLQLNTDGSFSYTPAAGFAGIDSFSYHASNSSSSADAQALLYVQPRRASTCLVAEANKAS